MLNLKWLYYGLRSIFFQEISSLIHLNMYREVAPLKSKNLLDFRSALGLHITFKAQVSKLTHQCTQENHSDNFLLQQDFWQTVLSSKYGHSTVPRRHLSVHALNVICGHLHALLSSLSKYACLLSQNCDSFLVSIKKSLFNSHVYYCTLTWGNIAASSLQKLMVTLKKRSSFIRRFPVFRPHRATMSQRKKNKNLQPR